jgi:hypothetical protein
MPTEYQIKQFHTNLKIYKRRYIKKKYSDLDESATRLMVNSFLTEVLGYTELEEIKTEYRIRGEYADYVIQLARKKHFIIEVKAMQLDLSEKHLRQSINYAANEGIDWIILTNGKQIELYRVLFGKPISSKKIFGFDLSDQKEFIKSVDFLIYLTKKSVLKSELEDFWKRFQTLEPTILCKNLYGIEVVRFLRRVLKKKTGLYFNDIDILDSIHQIITTKIESVKPKNPLNIIKK